MPKSKKLKIVYIVLYGHAYGIDYWVMSTEKKAWRSVKETLLSGAKELSTSHKKKLLRFLKAEEFGKALTLWAEQKEEWFEVNSKTVDA